MSNQPEQTVCGKRVRRRSDCKVKTNRRHYIQSLTLSITTRWIWSLCNLAYMIVTYNDNMGCIELSLVCRGEARVFKAILPVDSKEHGQNIRAYCTDAIFIWICISATVALTPIRRLINAIGILHHNDKVYIPGFAENRIDAQNRFPESVILLKRDVVVSLHVALHPRTLLYRWVWMVCLVLTYLRPLRFKTGEDPQCIIQWFH